jgi:hypothetical protein
MVAMLCTAMCFRVLYAKKAFTGAAAIGVLWTLLYVLVSGVLVKSLQLRGIMSAYLSVWWMILAITAIRSFGRQVKSRDSVIFMFHTFVSLGACCLSAIFIKTALEPLSHDRVYLALQCLLVMFGAALVFVLVTAYWLRMNEILLFAPAIGKLFGPKLKDPVVFGC